METVGHVINLTPDRKHPAINYCPERDPRGLRYQLVKSLARLVHESTLAA
jgi:hypothetical protein